MRITRSRATPTSQKPGPIARSNTPEHSHLSENPLRLVRILYRVGLFAACAFGATACDSSRPTPEWHQEAGYRWRDVVVGAHEAGFTPMPSKTTGIEFQNFVSDSVLLTNRILGQGAGVALGDVDGDGLPDVFAGAVPADSIKVALDAAA